MQALVKATADTLAIPTAAQLWRSLPGMVPPTDIAWIRTSVLHADGEQSSLTGAESTTCYDNIGTLWIEIYVPLGGGDVSGYANAQAFLRALRNYRGAVWFRRVRMEEMPSEGKFSCFHVKADFEYTDIT